VPEPNTRSPNPRPRGGLLLLALALAGCSHTPPQSTLRGSQGPDPARAAQVGNAVPKYEPRSKYGNPNSYIVLGQRYFVRPSAEGYIARGTASWYGPNFHGKLTSNREEYDMYAMTAAHKDLPLPTYARVTNLENGHSVVVRINDRGPFHGDRIIDLSYAAAMKLDMVANGTAQVEVQAITPELVAPRPAYSSADFSRRAAQVGSEALRVAQVEPAKVSAQPAHLPAPPEEQLEALYLQLGAFSARANAEQLRAKLMLDSARPEQVIIHQSSGANGPLYRVRIGPLANMEEATTLSARLTTYGYSEPRLVLD